jgi:uncharacterized membrane protein YdjX (TVP38/TMEM64 family)
MPVKPEAAPLPNAPTADSRPGWRRKLPILLILAAALTGAIFFHDALSFDTLARHREALLAFRDAHYLATAAVFMVAYVAIVAFSLPGGTVATLTGGFLFGLFPGVLFNVASATLGAILIFLAARAGYGARFCSRIEAAGGKAARLQAALRENEWSVLFLMRLVPVVPFFLANLLPAFVGANLMRFAVTTFLGIIPAALVFTSLGSGLGKVFAMGKAPELGVIFTPPVLVPLLGLAALAAVPILLKLIKRDRA